MEREDIVQFFLARGRCLSAADADALWNGLSSLSRLPGKTSDRSSHKQLEEKNDNSLSIASNEMRRARQAAANKNAITGRPQPQFVKKPWRSLAHYFSFFRK